MTKTKRQNMTSEAFKRRVDAAERRLLLAAIGWDPVADFDCCASNGELHVTLLEAGKRELSDTISINRSIVLRPYYDARLGIESISR